jgi:hypothetical protein
MVHLRIPYVPILDSARRNSFMPYLLGLVRHVINLLGVLWYTSKFQMYPVLDSARANNFMPQLLGL